MQLKILSWNIWINCDFAQVKDFLRSSDADIIGLQEVKTDDPDRNIIDYLASLGYEHVFTPVRKAWKDRIYNDGPAVFSKHRIRTGKIHSLSEIDSRSAVQADIEVNGTTMHIFSTHLLHTHQQQSKLQESQIDTLIKLLPADHTIVMGDFNATPESNTIQKMKKVLTDTDPQSIPTWSMYPEGCSVCQPQAVDTRLDYIFTSDDIKSSSFKVERSKASDHLPISIVVEL